MMAERFLSYQEGVMDPGEKMALVAGDGRVKRLSWEARAFIGCNPFKVSVSDWLTAP